MIAESDGKGRRGGQPDLLASLPAEHPPSSRPDPGIDPATIEELLTGVRDLREQLAGVREAVSAERPAPVTREILDTWGGGLVARIAEAARTAAKLPAAPKDDAAAAHIGRIEEAAAKAAAAAERIGGQQDSTADRVAAEIKEAVTTIETALQMTRVAIRREVRQEDPTLRVIEAYVAKPSFGWGTIFVWLFVFGLGMLLESRIHILYNLLRAG